MKKKVRPKQNRIKVIEYKLYKKNGKVDVDKTARKMAESICEEFMKINPEAIERAEEVQKERNELQFCLKYNVCPSCAKGGLKKESVVGKNRFKWTCEHCGFTC